MPCCEAKGKTSFSVQPKTYYRAFNVKSALEFLVILLKLPADEGSRTHGFRVESHPNIMSLVKGKLLVKRAGLLVEL